MTCPSGPLRRARALGPASRVQIGAVIAGRYQLVKLVGEGAFGSVYRADDLDVPGHKVALKLMHRPPASAAERERCLREVRLIAAVEHPSVVTFKDHGWHRERFFIVMPWYDGVTLGQRLRERPEGLRRAEAQAIFERLAEALDAMHARGIRHQDIKPDNILLARFGDGQPEVPVLLDLGVGATDEEDMLAFTPDYVAPETARAHIALCTGQPPPPLDGRADVYSLALTLLDALAPSARPHGSSGGSPASLAARAKGEDLQLRDPRLKDLAASFARWLHVDPDRRPSARQLRAELCVLTRRARRRAERLRAAARWGPALLGVLAISAALYGRLDAEKDRSRSKDAQLLAQEARIGRAMEALGVLERERVAERRAHQRAEQDRAALRAANASKAGVIRRLRAALQAEADVRAQAQRELEERRAEAARLSERVTHLEDALATLDAEKGGLAARLARAERDRHLAVEERAQLSSELASAQAELERLRDQLRDARAHAQQLAAGALRQQAPDALVPAPPQQAPGKAPEQVL